MFEMTLKSFAGLILFFSGLSVFAQDAAVVATTYNIRQIILDQNLIIVETSNPNEVLNPGKVFLANFPNGKQCSLVMKERNGNLIILNSSSCANAQEITKSSPIEVALIDVPAPTPAPVAVLEKPIALPTPQPLKANPYTVAPPEKFRKMGLSIHYSTANEILFRNAYLTTTSGNAMVEAVYRTDTSAGFGISFMEVAPQSWGFQTNFLYEPARNINSLTLKGNGTTATGIVTGVHPKVSFLMLEGNWVHRWESFYMPIGINYNIPTISDLSTGYRVDYEGSLGVLIGGGVLLNEKASLEFFIRSMSMRLTETDGTSTLAYDLGTMTGFGFGYKFWF
jgi:hypothetical protein